MKRISDNNNIQFGYYCGYPITDIPDTYLTWILSDFEIDDEDDQALYDAAVKENDRRLALTTETHDKIKGEIIDKELELYYGRSQQPESNTDVVLVEEEEEDGSS